MERNTFDERNQTAGQDREERTTER